MQKNADKLLLDATFLTMETLQSRAEAVAIGGDRILFVGSEKDARRYVDENTEIISLGGRVACPGLIDCHTHPMGIFSTSFLYLNFSKDNTTSLKRVLSMVREKAESTPKGEWIVGRNFDESKFAEGPVSITAKMLDEVTSDHPVFLIRTCGHVAVLNSLALEKAGFTDESRDPETGGHFFRDENGHLTGMISGSLVSKVPSTPLTPKQKKDAFIDGVQKDYFSKGITATAEMGSVTRTFRMFQELEREGRLKLRVGYYCAGRRNPPQKPMCQRVRDMGLTSGFGSDRVRFLGVKYVMDGSTGGRTAAFSQPYQNQPDNCGELYNDPAILREDLLCCAKAGLQISIHAIGDRAIEEALQAIEFVNTEGVDTRPLHWRLEHLESPTPHQIRRIEALSLLVGLSSAFIYSLGDSHLAALGYERLKTAFPAKTLLAAGISVGCNSDCPICDVNPMWGIYSMVTRKTEKGASFGGTEESVSRLEALSTYTAQAARLILREDLGTLTVGKKADITVFDGDFLSIPEEEIKFLAVYSTFCGGEEVWHKK